MQVLCLKRQLQLLLQHHAEASEQVLAAAGVLEGLQRQQYQALHDVEVQLKLKQGQVGPLLLQTTCRYHVDVGFIVCNSSHEAEYKMISAQAVC